MTPVNFRDVGETLGLWLEPSPLSAGRLFRGGCFDTLDTLHDLGEPKTILNLRFGADPTHLRASIIHLPAPDSFENYDTRRRQVAVWIRRCLAALASPEAAPPIYMHCTSGRDRTGVIVAAVLTALGLPRQVIAEEYMLSAGGSIALIEQALDGMATLKLDICEERDGLQRRFGSVD